MKRNLLIIAGAFIGLAICTILFVFLSNPMMKKYKEVQDWPSVQGTVSSSDYNCWEEEKKVDDKYVTETKCEATVMYHYIIDGKSFVNSNIRPNSGIKTTYDRNTAQQIVAKYPVGAKVEVFYNPEDKSNAVLERKMNIGSWLLYLLPFILGVAIVFVVGKNLIGAGNVAK
jgi:ABC-type antimicrobial peptide transport system permease subunit